MTPCSPIEAAPLRARRIPWHLAWYLAGLAVLCLLALPARAESVRVVARAADGYGHIAFNLSTALPYNIRLDGRRLIVMFQRPVTGDFASIVKTLPGYISSADVSADGRTVIFGLKGRFRVHTTKLKREVQIDLYPVNAPATPRQVRRPAAKPPALAAKPAAEARPRARLAPKRRPKPPPTQQVAAKTESKSKSKTKSRAEAAPGKPVAAGRDPVRGVRGGVRVRLIPDRGGGGFTLRFDWPTPVAAAVYRRGGYIWMVFDQAEMLDFAPAWRAGGSAAETLEQLPLALTTVARIKVGEGVNPTVRGDGAAWLVGIRRQQGVPAIELPVRAEPRAPVEPRLLLPVADAVNPRVVTDSEAAETVYVIPVRRPNAGIGSDRVFPEFRLLATAQGIVVRAGGDGILVKRVRDGVQVTSTNGLILSGSGGEAGGVGWPGARGSKVQLIDVSAWRKSNDDFTKTKQALQTAAVEASRSERGRHRLRLAQFYFAHGFYTDALGPLKLIRGEDPIAVEPAFKMLYGATALLLRDLKSAGAELMDPGLNRVGEAALWRGVLKARQTDWDAAARYFDTGRGLLRFYAEPFRSDFTIEAARVSIARGKPDAAVDYLNLLAQAKPNRTQQLEAIFLRGQALKLKGDPDAALVQWQKVIDGAKGGAVSIRARLARIGVLVEQEKLTRKEAIAKLEGLRFEWRGDALEFAILERLAGYYLDLKNYRHGLESMRRASTANKGNRRAGAMRADMRRIFRELFIKGKADELSPISALALFYEYRRLVPNDARGDEMIARLTDRLIAVDLLEAAAKLRQEQIAERLADAPVRKAEAGLKLAAVRLLDRKPDAAIAALDSTVSGGLPPALVRRRTQVKAQAQAEKGKFGAALELLDGDTSLEAELVRAAVYWRAKNWPGAARALGSLAGAIKIEDGALAEADSRLVLSWATALTLAGDRGGLVMLRRRFDLLMGKSPYSNAYRVIANEIGGEVTDYPALVDKVRDVSYYEGFMTAYRERLKDGAKAAN